MTQTPKFPVQCPHCDKEYSTTAALAMHMRTHGTGCGCPYCGKTFSRPWLLQGHIRTHTGEKPFSCNICSKRFADKSNLRAHTQTHSGSKPFSCANCGKAFALKSYLSKHEESSCFKNKAAAARRSKSMSEAKVAYFATSRVDNALEEGGPAHFLSGLTSVPRTVSGFASVPRSTLTYLS